MKRAKIVSLFLAMLLALLPLCALAEEQVDYGRVTEPSCPPGLQRTAQAATTTDLIAPDCWPYSAVACLDVEMACGCSYPGATAFLVADDCLMTAGHMLVCLTHNRPITRLRATFGCMEQDGELVSYLYRYETDSPECWYNPLLTAGRYGDQLGWDYGYVRVPAEAGQTVGHFGLSVRSDEELTDLAVEIVGYPGGAFTPLTGNAKPMSEQILRHWAPSGPGHSGSPVFDADGYVVAVHNSHTVGGGNVTLWCSGARITQDVIDEMRGHGFFQ